MCGIVGMACRWEVAHRLVESILRLDYRRYDSCGLATVSPSAIAVRKDVGPVRNVLMSQALDYPDDALGIAHIRRATHGQVCQENAHPHLSCDKAFAVVHNGIISNFEQIRDELWAKRNHLFFSDTDSEVIVHLLEESFRNGCSVEEAFVRVLRRLEGTFAIAMISTYEPHRIFCARQDSPLLLGICGDAICVGSDINAFLPEIRQAILLADGEYAVISSDGYSIGSIADGDARRNKLVNIGWQSDGVTANRLAILNELA
jgi:glucosamine--fructose-6-phosphate aminotransferase (isomerizing)